MIICINVKVFEWVGLLCSATNMVTQIIYLGRMEVEDWYYAVFHKYFSIGFPHFGLGYFSMMRICINVKSFFHGPFAVFCREYGYRKSFILEEWRVEIGTTQSFFFLIFVIGYPVYWT